MESIFAGKLSLTDDIPEPPAVTGEPRFSGRFTIATPPAQQTSRMLGHIKNAYGQTVNQQLASRIIQFDPLPEPGLSSAAQRVRAEAARLGINYDAEVAKVLNRLRGFGLGGIAPNPWNKKAGPDPVSDEAMRQAERATAEILKREHGMQITWEE